MEASYMFNIYVLLIPIIAIARFSRGLMLIAHERFSRNSALFFLVTFTNGIWFFGFSWIYSSSNVGKNIINAQGGHIWCESETGIDSRFNYTLPIAKI
jgi:hypothetical protein